MSTHTQHVQPTSIERRNTQNSIGPNRSWFAGALSIISVTLLVYAPSLHGGFLIDDRYVTLNPLVASSDGLYRIWFSNESIDYWPVSYTTLWFEWRLWGINPTGYHITNLALHIATSLLLWKLLRMMLIPGAWLAALLFAIHPVNVESVAWISQRTEMLASLFLVLSFLCFVRDDAGRKTGHEGQAATGITGWYWLGLLAYLLAMLSKISVASMPLILVLIIWWLHGRITKRDLLRTIPFFGVAFVLILVQLAFQKHGDPIPDPSWAERFAGAGAAVWFYFAKALLLIDQSFFYPHWEILTRELLWWLPLMAVVAVTVMLIWRCTKVPSKWNRSLLFAWTFFCVALAPAVGIIQNGSKSVSKKLCRRRILSPIGAPFRPQSGKGFPSCNGSILLFGHALRCTPW